MALRNARFAVELPSSADSVVFLDLGENEELARRIVGYFHADGEVSAQVFLMRPVEQPEWEAVDPA